MLLPYIISQYDLYEIRQALLQAHYVGYAGLLIAFVGTAWLMDAIYLSISYQWASGVGTIGRLLQIRGASYLLSIISMFVGLGGVVYIMNKKEGVPYHRGTGVAIYELYQELGALGFLSLGAGLLFGGDPDSPLQGAIIFGFFAVAFYVACFTSSRYRKHFMPHRDKQAVLSIFADFHAGQYAVLLGIKLVYNLIHGLFVAFAFHCFAVKLPMLYAVACTQVLQFVHSLPVSAFGIGVDQLTFGYLFAPWESTEGKIIAFSVVYTFSLVLARGLLGLFFVREFFRDFRKEIS